MTKFKVGDKVKIIGKTAYSYNNIGDIGIVTRADWDGSKVSILGGKEESNWSYNVELELTTEDVPIGYYGYPKDMNMKDGDVVEFYSTYYTVVASRIGICSVNSCGHGYTLISRANTDDKPWILLTDKDAVCSYTNDIACFNGFGVAYRKKAPVVRTIEVFIHTEGVRSGVKATVVTKDDVIDWSTLKVKDTTK